MKNYKGLERLAEVNNRRNINEDCDNENDDSIVTHYNTTNENKRNFRKLCRVIENLFEKYGMCEDEINQYLNTLNDQFKENHPNYSLEKTKEQIEQDEIEDFCKLALGDEYGKPKPPKKKKGFVGNMLDDFKFWK